MRSTGSIVQSVLERSARETASAVERPAPGADILEIRADHLRAAEVAALVPRCPLPVIVTVRTPGDGGAFNGSEEERRRLLEAALEAGAAFVDVEWGSTLEDLLDGRARGRGILSHHGAACDLTALRALRDRMASRPAARLKIVPVARRVEEVSAIRELLAGHDGPPLAGFAMGAAGTLSRLLALRWGSWGTYGATRPGRETASGQFTVADLHDIYGVTSIRASTATYGLVGAGIPGSPSPAMHAAGYREAGLDARYLPIDLERFDDVLPLADPDGPIGLAGFGVTVPHKESAYRRCRAADSWSRAARAVNTVRVREDGWHGVNTDAAAAERLLRPAGSLRGRRAVVLGAGGAARAMAAVLLGRGARVALCNRSDDRARRVAGEIGADVVRWDDRSRLRPDVLVQATPLGRNGEVVVEASGLPTIAVLDAVYATEPTPLVTAARRAGVLTLDGLDLLVAQGVLQFAYLTGRMPAEETFRRAAEAFLARARRED